MSEIVIRRQFPNFICDGMPLGSDVEAYMHRFHVLNDFYDLEWVAHADEMGACGWFLSNNHIMCVYNDGMIFAHAILEEGDLPLPKFNIDNIENIYDFFAVTPNSKE